MQKVTLILLTSAIYLIGCSTGTTEDHGHDHGPNGEHLNEEIHDHGHNVEHDHHVQEEFIVDQDNVTEQVEEVENHNHDHDDHSHAH